MKSIITKLTLATAIVAAPLTAATGASAEGEKYVLVSHAPDSDSWWNTIKNGVALAGEQMGVEVEEAKLMVRGNLSMDPLRHSVTWKNMDVSLTVTEFLLLQALAQRPGFVKSRDQLMDVAYDDQVYVDDRTIDSHIKRLRKKMRSVDNEFSAIETLYGIGYRYNEE